MPEEDQEKNQVEAEGSSNPPGEDDPGVSAPEIAEALPSPEVIEKIERTMGVMSGMSYPPYMSKIGAPEINKMLEITDKENERQHRSYLRSMFFYSFWLIIGIIAIYLLLNLLKSDPEVFKIAITALVSLIVAFAGGFGWGRSKRGD